MGFEWDADKDRSNRLKHGKTRAPYPVEDRGILISKYKGKLWTAIYTTRGDATRIISVRRARRKEAKFYEKETTGEKRRGI